MTFGALPFLLAVVALSGVDPLRPCGSVTTNDCAALRGRDQHAGHGAAKEKPQAPKPAEPDHAGHQQPAADKPSPGAPPITDADRAAAFPDVRGHSVSDTAIHYFVLFDRLEWQGGNGNGISWDTSGWVGGDRDRFRFRTEGRGSDGRIGAAHVDLLYGRAVTPWWEIVAGVRQDVEPGAAQTWAAVGVQGRTPYWFELEATAYVGASGRTRFRVDAEYDLLLTDRLIVQPVVEADIAGKADPARQIGSGLSTVETGLRLRYEIRREFAPYLGITWSRKLFGTAGLAEAAGQEISGARVTAGVRGWF
jgi:copper resistance protein B